MFIKKVLSSKPYTRETLYVVMFNILLIVIFLVMLTNLPPVIPLFYGFPKGEQQLAQRNFIIMPLLVSLLTSLVNYSLIQFNKSVYLQKVLFSIGVVATLLSLVTTIRVFMLIGNI